MMQPPREDDGGLVIRLATPADAAGVARILNEVISDGRHSLLDTPFSDEDERAYIRALSPRGFIHVAESPAGGIVAVQTVEPYASFTTRAFDHVATMGTWVRRVAAPARVGPAPVRGELRTGP